MGKYSSNGILIQSGASTVNITKDKTMTDKLFVNVTNNDAVVKSYDNPRVVIAVIAAQIGLSISEIQQLLSLSDAELQTTVDAITARLNQI